MWVYLCIWQLVYKCEGWTGSSCGGYFSLNCPFYWNGTSDLHKNKLGCESFSQSLKKHSFSNFT